MELKPILRERACAVCLKDDELLMVNLYDKAIDQHFWMPPGGGVEEEEDPALTAEREAKEEAGVLLRARPETRVTRQYTFKFNGLTFLTKTHFYLAEYEGEDADFDPQNRNDNHVFAHEWVPLGVALDRMAPWEEIQTAVYELVYPLLRGSHGTETKEF